MIAILTVLAATKLRSPLCAKRSPDGEIAPTPTLTPPVSALAMTS